MNEIIKNVRDAEAKAAEIKDGALSKASVILECAETEAVKISAANEAECKALKDGAVKKAEAEADRLYKCAVDNKRREAKEYADKLSAKADVAANEVVRRITSGCC